MFSKLFHKDVYFVPGMQEICQSLQATLGNYFLSRHFQEHLENQLIADRSHTYLKDVVTECLNTLKDNPREVFEVELSKDAAYFGTHDWFVTKYCCRIPYSDTQDLVVAIRPKYRDGEVINNMIVTAWMNSRTDHHYTLDGSKYCSEEAWKTQRF